MTATQQSASADEGDGLVFGEEKEDERRGGGRDEDERRGGRETSCGTAVGTRTRCGAAARTRYSVTVRG